MNCASCNTTIWPVYERKPDGLLKCVYQCDCGKPNPGNSQEDQVAAQENYKDLLEFFDSWNDEGDEIE